MNLSPTSVYVHFPWCLKKCPYCDFATRKIDQEEIPHARYADAVLRELEGYSNAVRGRQLVSIFLGGGTPSLWAPKELGRVIRGIVGNFGGIAENLEVTIECNPSSLLPNLVSEFMDAGVNRVSMGVQSLNDEHLRYLGRLHSASQALDALKNARQYNVRISADLMFGLPGQSSQEFLSNVEQILDTGVQHVSAYALTIEAKTPFGELHRKGKLPIAREEDYAQTFEETRAFMADQGFEHYEVSNYAKPGEASLHNQHYWRGGAYLGLGAAAVGCLDGGPGKAMRWTNVADPHSYMAQVIDGVSIASEESLDAEDLTREALMLGLRTREGLHLDALARRTGHNPVQGREKSLRRRVERGDLRWVDQHLSVPHERWLFLDGIVAELF